MPEPANPPDAKQALVLLLPSDKDASTIVTNTTAWLWGPEKPTGSVLTPDDPVWLRDVSEIARGSTMHVAKTLLLFALYMQQLPAGFDTQILQFPNVENAITLIVERVKIFILSSEDEACSLGGLECLILLCLVQVNDGALRKAWMTNRRVLDIARLQGLQNSFSASARNTHCANQALCRRLWQSLICADCYCSLMLGLEPGPGSSPFGSNDYTWADPLASEEAEFQRQVALIIARIAQRNALGLYRDRKILREIEQTMNKVQDSLPASWWRTPLFCQNRSSDSAQEPNRLICQLWFFQAQIFAYMPFAFGETTEGSPSSLERCMEASRTTLHRYLGLQHAKDHLSRCRTVDQSAFIGALILLLAKAQLQQSGMQIAPPRYDSDRALLEQVIDSFDAVGKACSREHIARQISVILSTMLEISDSFLSENRLAASDSFCEHDNCMLRGSCPARRIDISFISNKIGMEEVMVSSILPALGAHSIALHLVNLFFEEGSALNLSNSIEEESGNMEEFNLDDLINPSILHESK